MDDPLAEDPTTDRVMLVPRSFDGERMRWARREYGSSCEAPVPPGAFPVLLLLLLGAAAAAWWGLEVGRWVGISALFKFCFRPFLPTFKRISGVAVAGPVVVDEVNLVVVVEGAGGEQDVVGVGGGVAGSGFDGDDNDEPIFMGLAVVGAW